MAPDETEPGSAGTQVRQGKLGPPMRPWRFTPLATRPPEAVFLPIGHRSHAFSWPVKRCSRSRIGSPIFVPRACAFFNIEKNGAVAVRVRNGWDGSWWMPSSRSTPRCRAVPSRVTQTFYLGCTAHERPSNWLHWRLDRRVLPRPLETQKGAPCGRIGMAEGGRDSTNGADARQ